MLIERQNAKLFNWLFQLQFNFVARNLLELPIEVFRLRLPEKDRGRKLMVRSHTHILLIYHCPHIYMHAYIYIYIYKCVCLAICKTSKTRTASSTSRPESSSQSTTVIEGKNLNLFAMENFWVKRKSVWARRGMGERIEKSEVFLLWPLNAAGHKEYEMWKCEKLATYLNFFSMVNE